jgi:hypothetical protein
VKKDGKLVEHALYECHVWHFFAKSMSKGKKNDHITHNAHLDQIVSFYRKKFITDKKAALMALEYEPTIVLANKSSSISFTRLQVLKIATMALL